MEGKLPCRICRASKLPDDFFLRKDSVTGRRTECKDCLNKIRAEYRAGIKDAIKKKDAAYYSANKETINKKKAAYRARTKAKTKKMLAVWYAANKEHHKKKHAAYLATPRGRAAKRRAHAKRRARKKGATIGDMKLIVAWEETWRTADAVQCHWCGRFFPGKDCQPDHIVPLARGGRHDRDNLCVSCEPCNSRKSDMDPTEFNATLEQPWLFW